MGIKYKITEYRKDELIIKIDRYQDKQKQIYQWIKQSYINLQEFRFLLENLEIVKNVELYTRLKKETTK